MARLNGVIITTDLYPALTRGQYYSVWDYRCGHVEVETELLVLNNNGKYQWIGDGWDCKLPREIKS